MASSPRPVVGISACLLGARVRFNGDHKKQDWLAGELTKFVTFHPVCPEMEMGLGTPREPMRLEAGKRRDVRLRTHTSRRDLTLLANRTSRRILSRLPELDGFVFKKGSPSCGLERVKVFDEKMMPVDASPGLFARRFMAERPQVPAIEEGRLADPEQREHFVIRVFAHWRLCALPARISEIQKFHEAYKLLLMAHSPVHYRSLGRVAANSEKQLPSEVRAAYAAGFLEALSLKSTTKKRVNVLQHALGYFREHLTTKERESILGTIERYRLGELSFLAALTLVQHEVDRLSLPYLRGQLFFEPYPRGLALRRHL